MYESDMSLASTALIDWQADCWSLVLSLKGFADRF